LKASSRSSSPFTWKVGDAAEVVFEVAKVFSFMVLASSSMMGSEATEVSAIAWEVKNCKELAEQNRENERMTAVFVEKLIDPDEDS
jgi:hypothetical protein